jgi:hypothetical protein
MIRLLYMYEVEGRGERGEGRGERERGERGEGRGERGEGRGEGRGERGEGRGRGERKLTSPGFTVAPGPTTLLSPRLPPCCSLSLLGVSQPRNRKSS